MMLGIVTQKYTRDNGRIIYFRKVNLKLNNIFFCKKKSVRRRLIWLENSVVVRLVGDNWNGFNNWYGLDDWNSLNNWKNWQRLYNDRGSFVGDNWSRVNNWSGVYDGSRVNDWNDSWSRVGNGCVDESSSGNSQKGSEYHLKQKKKTLRRLVRRGTWRKIENVRRRKKFYVYLPICTWWKVFGFVGFFQRRKFELFSLWTVKDCMTVRDEIRVYIHRSDWCCGNGRGPMESSPP